MLAGQRGSANISWLVAGYHFVSPGCPNGKQAVCVIPKAHDRKHFIRVEFVRRLAVDLTTT